jgi:hypothetical protein
MTKDEAMKLALVAMNECLFDDQWYDAKKALEEALKQEQGEPWLLESTQELAKAMAKKFYPEVTQWEVLDNLAGVISQIDNMTTGLIRKPKQEQGEPVGVVCIDISKAHMMYGTEYLGQTPDKKTAMLFKDLEVGTQLYTSPQQRTWIDLEIKEVDPLCEEYKDQPYKFYVEIRKLLKEKNNG